MIRRAKTQLRHFMGGGWVEVLICFTCFMATRANAVAGSAAPTVFVGKEADGQLEVFKLGPEGGLYHRWRKNSDGAWSSWSSLGGSLFPGIAIVTNAEGQMEVFGVDRASHALECIRQSTTNSLTWSSWTNLGGTLEAPVAVGRNQDGRLEVFALDIVTHQVRHLWQTDRRGGWSDWSGLGGSLQAGMVVTRNQDGRLELFGLAADGGALRHCWQMQPNTTNDWSKWASLGGTILPQFVVGQNAAGRLEVFGVNVTNHAVNRICQTTAASSTNWTPWLDFGETVKAGLTLGQSGDKRMEVFAVKADDSMLLHRWEDFVNGSDVWSHWTSLGEASLPCPAVGCNEDGDLEVFAVNPTNPDSIRYRRQISGASDWLDWSSLDQPAPGYTARAWQVDEGLPDNLVQAITQTPDGYLWVGTRAGLAKFDGVQFSRFDARNTPAIKNSSITALYTSADGALWIGTAGGGLARFKDGMFTHYGRAEGLAGDDVRAIYESEDGSLWIGTTTGMSRYQKRKFVNYAEKNGLSSDVVSCIYEDRDANLWIATGKGLNRLNKGGTMDSFIMPDGLPNDSVRVICQDKGGRIWIGSNNGLLWYDQFWGNHFYAYNARYGLSDTFVSAICEDQNDNLWVGTYSGLNRFHDGRFYPQFDDEGLPFSKVNALFEDDQGDLWVGTQEGLIRLTPKCFSTYTRQQGLTHNNIMSMLQDRKGNMWIGTWGGGLDRLSGEKVTAYAPTNGLSQDLILSLCEGRDGSIWAGADFDGGLTRLKDGKISHYTWRDGLINARIQVLHEDRAGNLWIGTSQGLSCLKNGKFTKYTVRDGLAGNNVRAILEDPAGVLWFGTEGGLSRRQDGRFVNFTTREGLSDNAVIALYQDQQGTIWIGTDGGGLSKYQGGQFAAYGKQQGLFSDVIFSILEDDEGWLWMSCPQGVFRVRKNDFAALDQGTLTTLSSIVYGKADGMESPQCNGAGKPSAWKSSDGRLWFPTSKGLVTVDPRTVKIDHHPPTVYIEQVVADRKPLLSSGASDSQNALAPGSAAMLRIPPGHGELQFQYTALNLAAPQKSRFQYKLDNIDADWVDAGTRRTAYYNNLPPGTYQFHVKACNQDGVWNETGASLSFVLLPYYWQTWWFRSLGALTLIGSISGLARYATRRRMQRKLARLEQQHAIEKERGRIAKDMHDQIGAGLTQIGLLSEFARREADKNGGARVHAEKIHDVARELAQTLDEIVWMVNPRNDTLNKLGLYLAAYAEEYFQATNIRCRLDIPPGLPPCPLTAELRHNLFLTVKEALNNIVKHSQASEAHVRLALKDSRLEIVIEDNGTGFSVETTNFSRNGISNMKERIEEIGGTFEISARPDNGTRICLRVPIKGGSHTRLFRSASSTENAEGVDAPPKENNETT